MGLSARVPACRLAGLGRLCVPARRPGVDPAAQRKMIVEHRDLLMMAASDGMRAVEPKADRARHFPAQQHRDDARHDELLQSPEIPAQDVYIAIGAILDRKSTRLNSSH